MSRLLLVLFLICCSVGFATQAPLLTLSDESINPGTADYLISGINFAEKTHAPYVVIQLDTPGGLLTSTRHIIQAMLNSPVPIVVYIGPRGARAGSAGTLITYAADVAVMAPGTNIGAAHPINGDGAKMDKTLSEKITNDTVAFVESLAKLKHRDEKFAERAIRESASIPSDEALKDHVIDFIAEDLPTLQAKLKSFPLPVPKAHITTLSDATLVPYPKTVRETVSSFFSDPNLAYLILTLGGLCIWVELTHPGLIFPGVLGGLCVLLSLVSFSLLPIHFGALFMILGGMGLLIAELFFPTYGALGIGGILCFLFGSLFLMNTSAPDLQISRILILSIAVLLVLALMGLSYVLWTSRRLKVRSGLDTLVGEGADVREPITSHSGKVFVHGEIWNAISRSGETLAVGTEVVVVGAKDMLLIVDKHSHTHHKG